MNLFLLILPMIVAVICFGIALKIAFNKHVIILSFAVTMVILMFAMHKLTLIGTIFVAVMSLSVTYILIYFIISVIDKNSNRE